jgi:hypothetical protein
VGPVLGLSEVQWIVVVWVGVPVAVLSALALVQLLQWALRARKGLRRKTDPPGRRG